MAIQSVKQRYESTERCHDYKTDTRMTYRKREQPMDIRKSNDNFKDGKPKCFNCNKYGHIAREYWLEKKEWETWTCFKYNKKEYIAKNCEEKQIMKK